MVARLRSNARCFGLVPLGSRTTIEPDFCAETAEWFNEAADEIERLRKERETYRTCYLKCLASTVWKPNTQWKTYRNPQREDGLFVATVGDLVRSYQAIPDRALSIRCGLPHDEATEVVEILNAWTASDAAREKEL